MLAQCQLLPDSDSWRNELQGYLSVVAGHFLTYRGVPVPSSSSSPPLTMKLLSMLVLLVQLVNLPFVLAWSAASPPSGSSLNASDWTPSTWNCRVRQRVHRRQVRGPVQVSSECTSLCTPVLQNLLESLPDCNYFLKDNEGSNKKWDAYSSLTQCDQRAASDPVSVRCHSNSTSTISTAFPRPVTPSWTKDHPVEQR
ncbi:hypothetical protein PHYPSEUDO_013033 [Phytophthora pseudosyringae]|uniref:Elicitin n=1 Tax=Phytophthora pseudosyringae TaxID=221518 RepID=A0A8T1V8L5_9STRA|nr:hypothetical protein PHYPSEUDO_013033 [Phytophthora pseudosyringae]